MKATREISRFAWRCYRNESMAVRWLMRLRPRICPLEIVASAVPEGARVLDVGCGGGLLLAWLSSKHILGEGLGVDSSARAIAIARNCLSDKSLSFEVLAPSDPWPIGPFDVVTLVDVLHHVPRGQQRAFISRISGTAAQKVILKDLDPLPRWKRWMNALHDFIMTRRRVYPRRMVELVAWFEEDGFRVTRCERVDRLWYNHYVIEAQRDCAGDGGAS